MLLMLISEIESPDSRQFMTELYEDFGRLMYHTAKQLIDEPEGQEDVVQDALIKLIEKVETLRGLDRTQRASYIVHTVRNTAFKFLKRRDREQNKIIQPDFSGEEDDDRPLEELLLREELKEAFRTVWQTLPEREKLLLEGKYLLGQSNQELAEAVGIQPNSVRMALTRAKRTALKEIERRMGHDAAGQITASI